MLCIVSSIHWESWNVSPRDKGKSTVFFPMWGLSYSPDIAFHRAEVFNFSEVQLIFCIDHASGVISQKSSPNLRSSRLSPVLSSRSFIVLHFTFRSLIHF